MYALCFQPVYVVYIITYVTILDNCKLHMEIHAKTHTHIHNIHSPHVYLFHGFMLRFTDLCYLCALLMHVELRNSGFQIGPILHVAHRKYEPHNMNYGAIYARACVCVDILYRRVRRRRRRRPAARQ